MSTSETILHRSLNPSREFFSTADLESEFALATSGMTFETEQEKELRQLLFTYFSLGALWAVEKIAPGGILLANTGNVGAIDPIKNGDTK